MSSSNSPDSIPQRVSPDDAGPVVDAVPEDAAREDHGRRPPPRWLRPVLGLLLLIALGGSIYLSIVALLGGTAVGCGPDGGCAAVLASRWSRWLGLPVALPALSLYLGAIGALLFADSHVPPRVQQVAWNLLWAITSMAAAAAVWFLFLQAAWLKKFCPYCSLVHAAGLSTFLLLMLFQRPPLRSWMGIAPLTLLGTATLIAGQLAVPPPLTYEIQNSAQIGAGDPYILGDAKAPLDFAAFDRLVELRTKNYPQLGNSEAAQPLILMFDYTCPYCHLLHTHLLRLLEARPNAYRVVLVPVPLWPECNPYIQARDESHLSACGLARLSLAVWQVCPQQFERFDRWIVEQETPPTEAEALAFALTICDPATLEERVASEEIQQDLAAGIELYAFLKGGMLPKLLGPKRLFMGEIPAYEELLELLQEPTP